MKPLVTASWLANKLADPRTVILDATLPVTGSAPALSPRAHHLQAHIPGALFFDIEELSDQTSPLPHMLPSVESFSRSMSALGVGHNMTIVVYEQEGVFSAPRAWWMLRAFGAQEVYILDGGFKAWLQASLPTHSGEVHREPASFIPILDSRAVKDFSQVQGMISGRSQILDARAASRFAGTAPEPRPGIPSGHMPGSINIPFTELLKDNRFKSTQEIEELFQAKGVNIHLPVTTTCGSGITAAVLALGLEMAGAEEVSLYDGSWAEYAQHPSAIIENTKQEGREEDCEA